MRLWPLVVAVIAIPALALTALGWVLAQPMPGPDPLLGNDLVERAAESWDSLDADALGHPEVSLAVIAIDGQVRVRQHDGPITQLQATESGAQAYLVEVGGTPVGRLFVVDPARAEALEHREDLVWWTALANIAAVTALCAWVLWRVRSRVTEPFRQMSRWATEVADGDLSRPLRMTPGNAFGAFTESFDLMRTELARSREREQAERERTRVLIAQLSHDIRTPVATMAAQAELLRVTEQEPARQVRLDTVVAKAQQIDHLLAELFSANQSELASLPVSVDDHDARELGALLRESDADGRLEIDPVPACLVSYDERRMRQVLDNILGNAAKYAGTAVHATWHLDDDVLRLRLADSGPGVPPAELRTLLARGTRGSNAADKPGQGLGLHIAASLMERMSGGLAVRNLPNGFAVDLQIQLA